MKTKYIKILTNLYDTNKTGQETSGRMTLKRYYMITGTPHKTINTSFKSHTLVLILTKTL